MSLVSYYNVRYERRPKAILFNGMFCLILVMLDEPVKSLRNVSYREKREICFMLSTDIIKISLFVRDDK